jgi:hypothetical protein
MMGREDSYGNDPMQGKIMIQMSFLYSLWDAARRESTTKDNSTDATTVLLI